MLAARVKATLAAHESAADLLCYLPSGSNERLGLSRRYFLSRLCFDFVGEGI
jgi:hypothetical protein